MKAKFLISLAFCLFCVPSFAQISKDNIVKTDKEKSVNKQLSKDEIAFSIGDNMINVFWMEDWIGFGSYTFSYHHRLENWFWIGANLNISSALERHSYITNPPDIMTNIMLVPSVRFSYLNKPNITLYSGLSCGFGLILDYKYPGFRFFYQGTLLGFSIGKKNFFGGGEIGFGYKGLLSAHFGYRFPIKERSFQVIKESKVSSSETPSLAHTDIEPEIKPIYQSHTFGVEMSNGINVRNKDYFDYVPYRGICYGFDVGFRYTWNFLPYVGLDTKLKTALTFRDSQFNFLSVLAGIRASTPCFGKKKTTYFFSTFRLGCAFFGDTFEHNADYTAGDRDYFDFKFGFTYEFDLGIHFKYLFFGPKYSYLNSMHHIGLNVGVDICKLVEIYKNNTNKKR